MDKPPTSSTNRPLPSWLRDALHEFSPDRGSTKRQDPRQPATGLANVIPLHQPQAEQVSVRLYNVGSNGIGFTARCQFALGEELVLTPEGTSKIAEPENSVYLRVIHCTQTVQGFKIGCQLV